MTNRVLFLVVAIILIGTLLAGCGHKLTRDVYNDPERAKTSEAAKQPCADPVRLPDKDLNEEETSTGWGADRIELVDCGAKNKVLVQALRVLERSKAGK